MSDDFDMPQPLSRVHPNPEVEVSAGAIANRPEWAAQVMRVIAHWAHIEGDLAAILGKILKADIETTTAMYQAVVNADARRIMVRSAVEKAELREWQVVLFQAVEKATKASREQRNAFAHGVWGTAKEVPDALLLMRPRVVIDRNARYQQHLANKPGLAGIFKMIPYDHAEIMVYRDADFRRAVTEAMSAEMYFSLLYLTIGEVSTEQARRQLLNERPVQQAIESLTLESSPELRAQLRPPVDGEPPAKGVHSLWDEYWDRLERESD